MATKYSIAVVGLGCIGSAACRYLSMSWADPSTIIGIGEAESSGSTVFSSHYDQGRITRIVDPDVVWSQLAARSISSYSDLETESGIRFHEPVGFIRVSPFFGSSRDSLAKSLRIGIENGAEAKTVEDREEQFPYFGFRDGEVAVIENGGAGFVNPREMVKAQLAIAAKNGVRLVRETVTNLAPIPDGGVEISTSRGSSFVAERVLLCTGAYTNFVLPEKFRQLAVTIKAVSIVLAEVDEAETRRLDGMPSFIWRLDSHPMLHSVYGCPPIEYPDGRTYVKIGGVSWRPKILSTPDEFLDWFRSPGCEKETTALLDVLLQLLPGLRVKNVVTKPCVVSYTPSNYPYVDKLSEEIFVAAFGCGASAKSSDEIGKMASSMVCSEGWSYSQLDSSMFRPVFVDK